MNEAFVKKNGSAPMGTSAKTPKLFSKFSICILLQNSSSERILRKVFLTLTNLGRNNKLL